MFLSISAVILILVYFFDVIFRETPSVTWIRNKSRVFVQVFDYMGYLWLHVLNITDQK